MNYDRYFNKTPSFFDEHRQSSSSRSDSLSHCSIRLPGRAGRGYSTSTNRPQRYFKNFNRSGHNNERIHEPKPRYGNQNGDGANLNPSAASNINQMTNYMCPRCKQVYNYFKNRNFFSGRIPRILQCGHTLCEDCIKNSLKTTNSLCCERCSYKDVRDQKMMDYNHYIIGHITCSKMNGSPPINCPNISLVSTKLINSNLSGDTSVFVDGEDKCHLGSCQSPSTIFCLDCSGAYCSKCDEALHSSGKQLQTHKRRVNKKLSLELEKCEDHSMMKELFCNDCKETCCCYCMLEKHESHNRSYLHKLSNQEEIELKLNYEKATEKLVQLQQNQKKLRTPEVVKVSDLELEISKSFTDIHAQLYLIEKKLLEEAKSVKLRNSTSCEVKLQISHNIETLKYLKNCVEERDNKKFNLQLLLEKLKESEDMPTSFDSDDSSGSVKLVIDDRITELGNYFKLDYAISKPLEKENGRESTQTLEPKETKETVVKSKDTSQRKSSKSSSDKMRKSKHTESNENEPNFQDEIVNVTHVLSSECFYVQFKKEQPKLTELEMAIKKYIEMEPEEVEEVQIGDLYLAPLPNDRKKFSRVKAVEEIESEYIIQYKVHFIDFGFSSIFKKEELRHISHNLANIKPFAVQCHLDNLPKKSHFKLSHLLKGKQEVLMVTKRFLNNVYSVDLLLTTSQQGDYQSVTDLLSDWSSTSQLFSSSAISTNRIFDNSDKFKVGESHEVFVRYVVDLSTIYVQKVSYQNCLDSLTTSLQNHYHKSKCDIHLPVKGSDVVIHWNSRRYGSWHRARILNVSPNENKVYVFLHDLGRKLNVSWNAIRNLASKFITTESLVFPVKLADLAPNSEKNEYKLFLEKYTSNENKLKMLISNDEPLEVILFEIHSTFDENINALVVHHGFALSTGKLSSTIKWLHDSQDEEIEENEFLPIYKEDDDDDSEVDEPQCLKKKVEIVHFQDPYSIYVSLVSRRHDADKLFEEMQIHYKQELELKDSWNVNDNIAVFDSTDNCYYRGRIKEVKDNLYLVDLLDRVGHLWVSEDCLRGISDYFLHEPSIVLRCHLAHIKPAGDSEKWSRLSLEWFENLFKKYKDIYIIKVSDDKAIKSIPVTMWYSKIKQGTALEPSIRKFISIDKKVVKAGLAFSTLGQFQTIQNEEQKSKVVETSGTKCVIKESLSDDVISKLMNDVSEKLIVDSSSSNEHIETSLDNVESKEGCWLNWLPHEPLNKSEFYGYITCAEAEGYLYVRECEKQHPFQELKANMKEHLDSIPKTEPSKLREGQMVTIWYENFWYRGMVLSLIDDETVKVMMIDYGSDHIVPIKHLHSKIMYPEIRTMVTKIKLYNVHSKDPKWTSDDVDILLENVSEYSKIVIRTSLNDEIPQADIYDSEGVCLNDVLVKLSSNLYRIKRDKSQESTEKLCQGSSNSQALNPDSFEFKNVINNASYDSSNLSAWYDQVELEHAINSESNYFYCNLPGIPLGKKIKSDIISVHDYKTVSIYDGDDSTIDEEKFVDLSEALQTDSADLETLKEIKIGTPCVSMYKDNLWYRAKIFDVKDLYVNGLVTVFYVDYGNFEIVDFSDLKVMKEEWFNFPARFAVALINYRLIEKQQEKNLRKHIDSLIGKSKLIEIIKHEPLTIEIYDGDVLYYDAFIKTGVVSQ